MKNIIKLILTFLAAAVCFGCVTAQRAHNNDFSLNNTLSIFLLKNESGRSFCIPVQYIGDYQIQSFRFESGFIIIGGYEILLNKDEVSISVYLNESADDYGNYTGGFNQIYSEENGKVFMSKMNEPLAAKQESAYMFNQYNIFIERPLTDDEYLKISGEYEKGNIASRFGIEYDLVISNEPQEGGMGITGIYDDFELYKGAAIDPAWYPPNLGFFKEKYLYSAD